MQAPSTLNSSGSSMGVQPEFFVSAPATSR